MAHKFWVLSILFTGVCLNSCTSKKSDNFEKDPCFSEILHESVRVISFEQKRYGYNYKEIIKANEGSDVTVLQNVLGIQDIKEQFITIAESDLNESEIDNLLVQLKEKVEYPRELEKYVRDNYLVIFSHGEPQKIYIKLIGLLMIEKALRMNAEMIAF